MSEEQPELPSEDRREHPAPLGPARLNSGRSVVAVGGDGATTFLSTVMIVAGIGLAWPGLLLAAAGGVLAIIDLREFKRLNPWLFPDDASPESTAIMAPEVVAISRWALISLIAFSGVALAAVILSEAPVAVLIPAVLAGAVSVLQDRRLLRTLQAAARA